MATKTLLVNYSIPVGKYLKLGYRPLGAPGDPFTYVVPNPFFNQTPYPLVVNDAFIYDFELTTVCGANGECPNDSPPVYITEFP